MTASEGHVNLKIKKLKKPGVCCVGRPGAVLKPLETDMKSMQDLFDKTVAFSRNYMNEGIPASYIPELAQTDPSLFSLSVTALDGTTCSSGDSGSFFSICQCWYTKLYI